MEAIASVEKEVDRVLELFERSRRTSSESIDGLLREIENLRSQLLTPGENGLGIEDERINNDENENKDKIISKNGKSDVAIQETFKNIRQTCAKIVNHHRDLHKPVGFVGKAIDKNFNSDYACIADIGLRRSNSHNHNGLDTHNNLHDFSANSSHSHNHHFSLTAAHSHSTESSASNLINSNHRYYHHHSHHSSIMPIAHSNSSAAIAHSSSSVNNAHAHSHVAHVPHAHALTAAAAVAAAQHVQPNQQHNVQHAHAQNLQQLQSMYPLYHNTMNIVPHNGHHQMAIHSVLTSGSGSSSGSSSGGSSGPGASSSGQPSIVNAVATYQQSGNNLIMINGYPNPSAAAAVAAAAITAAAGQSQLQNLQTHHNSRSIGSQSIHEKYGHGMENGSDKMLNGGEKYEDLQDGCGKNGLFESLRNVQMINQVIIEHFLRNGMIEIADELSREAHLEIPAVQKEQFIELNRILDALKQKNLQPALEWAKNNEQKLQEMNSLLLFKLHRLTIIELLRQGVEKQAEIVYYARTNLQSLTSSPSAGNKYERDVQHLMGALLYLSTGIEKSPYKYLLDELNWREIMEIFRRDACALLGLSIESPLSITMDAGCVALPALLNINKMMQKQKVTNIWQSRDELPVEIDLGRKLHFHSTFACPILRQQSTENNPPVRLVCGHVISQDALHKLTQTTNSSKLKCPYCPVEQGISDAKVIHF